MTSAEDVFNTTDQSSPGYYKSSHTALLLLDFHALFVQKVGGPEAAAALQVAANMRTWAKSEGMEVIHCIIDVNSTPFPTCKGSDRLSGMLATMRSSGGEEAAALSEGGSEGEPVFVRRPGHVSALKSPGLEVFLQEKGIKSLILTGLSTSGCVLRTAVTAADAEYVVTVISDACADPVEGVHELLVGKLLNNRSYVATSAEFQEGFAKASST